MYDQNADRRSQFIAADKSDSQSNYDSSEQELHNADKEAALVNINKTDLESGLDSDGSVTKWLVKSLKNQITESDTETTTPSELPTTSSKLESSTSQSFEASEEKFNAARKLWKNFTDVEYLSGKSGCQVPKCSFFSYMPSKEQTVRIPNMPPKPAPDDVLREMIKENQGDFVRVVIGSNHYDCIPQLLRCYSAYFGACDWRQNEFTFTELEVPPLGFERMYQWLRFQEPIEINALVPVLQVANHLKMDLLTRYIWTLVDDVTIREKVAFRLYLQAKNMATLKNLRTLMLAHLRVYFLALVGHEDFVNLTHDDLMDVLISDNIGVNTEIEVFFAAMHWLNHDWERRADHLSNLMECVRFPYMPITFLIHLKQNCERNAGGNGPMYAFYTDTTTMTKLENAMSFIGLRCQYKNIEDFIEVCGKHGFKMCFPRKWIYHPKCPYHIDEITYPYLHNVTMEQFTQYVGSLQAEWEGDGPETYTMQDVVFDI